jgi:hypothetical protein
LTYDSYGPVHNRFHRGECITWASGGEGALDTPGPLSGIERRIIGQKIVIIFMAQTNSYNPAANFLYGAFIAKCEKQKKIIENKRKDLER